MDMYNISKRERTKSVCVLYILFITILTFLMTMTTNKVISGHGIVNDEKCLSITTWNSRGLVASIPYLRELMRSNDVICLSEHWLHSNRLTCLEEISDQFNVIARASKQSDASMYGISRGQGGVAIMWRKSMKGISPITEITHDRICGIRVQSKKGLVLNIYSVYMPSPGCSGNFDEVLDELSEVIQTGERGVCNILCGDFNADIGFLGGKRSNRKPTKVGKTLSKFFDEFGMIAVNMMPMTRGPLNTFNSGMGSSTIDYIAVPSSLSSSVLECEVLNDEILNTSDHSAIRSVFDIVCGESEQTACKKKSRIKWSKLSREIIHSTYTSKVDSLASVILTENDVAHFNKAQVDNTIDFLVSEMDKISNMLPKSKYRPNVRPYWNEKLKLLKKTKVVNYRNWVAKGRPRDTNCHEWIEHKKSKKAFRKELKFVQKEYEKSEIENLLRSAEGDKNKFWRSIKRSRRSTQSNSYAVKNKAGIVVQDLTEAVKVWKDHFSGLCTEKKETRFDEQHYSMVSRDVQHWYSGHEGDPFLDAPLTTDEVRKAIKKLNKGKTAGFDRITAEHLQNTGSSVADLLTELLNRTIQLEHVPRNFKIGTQIPLYKGKNTCSLDPNNYRGITLLTSLNKMFEILMWHRLKDWWEQERVISVLQGACKTGMSCLHSALALQETIAAGLDTGKNVYVAYFDVAKAFDSIWIDGLFHQLHNMGVQGRIWRILYQSYQDFWCKVRVGDQYSEWYRMECGIHQGGYLSLLKYTAFIDPLLRELENSNLGCCVAGVPTNPVGYADDMATCSISKPLLDQSLALVSNFSNKWRYEYNAKKSAIMVYGETKTEFKKGHKYRMFSICKQRVKETESYDHVGVKNCLFDDYMPRTEERVSKGRRAFHAITNVGIKKNGVSMKVCSTLFWSIIAPIVTYGCEIWVNKSDEVEILRKFQRMVGRRCQRFHPKSPNHSAYIPLGWLSLDRYIQGKKMMFLRSILVLDDDAICKRILIRRSLEFAQNTTVASLNRNNSPIFEIMKTSMEMGMFDICMNMIHRAHFYTKAQWKKLVWKAVWDKEDEDCNILYKQNREVPMLFNVIDKTYYLIWWIISDKHPNLMRMCEKMSAIVTNSSLLKSDDLRLKGKSFWSKVCERCNLGIREDAKHVIMQCPFY